jgi:DNA replication regulator DPB11
MKIVSLEWFQQSLERGMVLDEALFNPTMPVEQRGQGAWDRREFPSPAPGKRVRDAEPSQALNPFRRKLRRSASTKMGSQSEALWAGITAASSEKQHDENDDWTEDILDNQDMLREHTPNQGPLSPVGEVSADVDVAHDPHQPPSLSLLPNNNVAAGVFEGRIVFPYGFDDEKVLLLMHILDLANSFNRQTSYDNICKTKARVFHKVPTSTLALLMTSGEVFL